MAWVFGDGFDLYYNNYLELSSYWEGIVSNIGVGATGRFTGSRAIQYYTGTFSLTKTSSVNDSIHHICGAFKSGDVLTGTNICWYFTLYDGATAQCTAQLLANGTINLCSGASGGTVLATYPSAITLQGIWTHFEFEIVINNTTGSFKVRKDGSSTDSHSTTGLNTRASANNYANKIIIGLATATNIWLDDFFWKSDTSSFGWLGDMRCWTRMPASDASITFSRSSGSTNYSQVSEAQQDLTATYVYSSTAGNADFYGIATIPVTPTAIYAVTTRGFIAKSDAGTRTACVQLKSGATTVATSTLTLSSSFQWVSRTDMTDPNTGVAWTAAGVNAVQIGPKVVA